MRRDQGVRVWNNEPRTNRVPWASGREVEARALPASGKLISHRAIYGAPFDSGVIYARSARASDVRFLPSLLR